MKHLTSQRRMLLGIFVAVAVLPLVPVHAATVLGGTAYELPMDQSVNTDVYLAGETAVVRGVVGGDLVVGGSSVALLGTTTGDVLAVGGRVDISGVTQGDVRVLGGVVSISGTTREDLIVAGGDVVIPEGAVIEGDLIVYAQNLALYGKVNGALQAHVRTARLAGSVGGVAKLSVGEALEIRETASLMGGLDYRAPRPAVISDGAKLGSTQFEQGTVVGTDSSNVFVWLALECLVAFASAFLFQRLFPVATTHIVGTVLKNRGTAALSGFLLFLAWPLAAVLLCGTFALIVPGGILLFAYGALVLTTFSLTPIVVGAVLSHWLKKDGVLRVGFTALGAVSLTLIVYVPVLGSLARVLLFFLTFGVVCTLLYENVWRVRKPLARREERSIEPHDETNKSEERALP